MAFQFIGTDQVGTNRGISTRGLRGPLRLHALVLRAVGELRTPIRSPAFRRAVEQIPQRPDRVDVTGVLPRLTGSEHQLAAPAVMDPAVLAREHVERGRLRSLGVLAAVVAVVAV